MFNINPLAFVKRKKDGEGEPLPIPVIPLRPRGLEPAPITQPVLEVPPIPARMAPAMPSPFPETMPLPESMVAPSALPPPNLPAPNRTENAILNTPPPPPSQARKGFWGRLKDVGESFLLSGGNPLVAGITAANPNVLTRFKDRAINEPYWQRQRKIALGEAEALDDADRQAKQNELLQMQIANIPIDNQRQAEQVEIARRKAEADAQRQAESDRFTREGQLRDDYRGAIEKGAERVSLGDLWFPGSRPNANQGEMVTLAPKTTVRYPSAAQEIERKKAAMVPPNMSIHTETDDNGNVVKIVSDPKTGQTLNVENIGSVGRKTTTGRVTEKDIDKETIEYQGKLSEAASLVEQAQALENEAAALDKNDVEGKAKLTKEAREKRTRAQQLRSTGRSQKRMVKKWQGGQNTTQKTFPAANVDDFAKRKFNGDRAAAEAYLKNQGYTLQ